ncbi:asparaginase [Salinimicrobium sp. CDJ15-81-2]|uniref:Asparaginase domain-containing protein n=3 Tax=Flavobacteriaceae TaxID=49546 RepID=A0A9X3CWV4_9FLAO|nr:MULTISPECIES: asparaginase domain-containing protein [Flavobacteriaceae]MCX2838427.1 asparaginase domain-containing protein [Salinimicrobium profundisediminis]MDT0647096.1 asparaginase domain-containing protein [Zunongwangia sp. F260]NJW52175.1 asparaginase [Salinimicrobium oceani]NJY63500.1 asparaginase [Salinimicrobium nanhaiense]
MIHILTTGGTIEGLDYNQKQSARKISLSNFLESANVSFPFTLEEVFKKDSRFITQEDREFLAERIKATGSSKILITHGTFTMEDTAAHIGKLNLDKTIVLVGSFILGSSKNTDAPFNLGYAICSLQFLKPDVYVAMNGRIFHWSNVTKNLKTNKFEPKDEKQ